MSESLADQVTSNAVLLFICFRNEICLIYNCGIYIANDSAVNISKLTLLCTEGSLDKCAIDFDLSPHNVKETPVYSPLYEIACLVPKWLILNV